MGLAISDLTRTIARPFKTIPWVSSSRFITEIRRIVEEESISMVIVGLPITMKGTFSQKTREVVEVVEALKRRLPVPVEVYDERLTTVQAHQTLRELGKKPSRERERVDQIAATHLLQNYLDREKSRNHRESRSE